MTFGHTSKERILGTEMFTACVRADDELALLMATAALADFRHGDRRPASQIVRCECIQRICAQSRMLRLRRPARSQRRRNLGFARRSERRHDSQIRQALARLFGRLSSQLPRDSHLWPSGASRSEADERQTRRAQSRSAAFSGTCEQIGSCAPSIRSRIAITCSTRLATSFLLVSAQSCGEREREQRAPRLVRASEDPDEAFVPHYESGFHAIDAKDYRAITMVDTKRDIIAFNVSCKCLSERARTSSTQQRKFICEKIRVQNRLVTIKLVYIRKPARSKICC